MLLTNSASHFSHISFANMGFKSKSKNLLKSYLSHRTQNVKINNIFSTDQFLTCGVPQGSVLGPLFYILFTNDIFFVSEQDTQMISYADDTSITVWAEDLNTLYNKTNNYLNRIYSEELKERR